MKYKVSELEGALLDAAVAKAEVVDIMETGRDFRPSVNWAVAGPIIEREYISLIWRDGPGHWVAEVSGTLIERKDGGRDWASKAGETALIAAMRAYIASKFGEEIEL